MYWQKKICEREQLKYATIWTIYSMQHISNIVGTDLNMTTTKHRKLKYDELLWAQKLYKIEEVSMYCTWFYFQQAGSSIHYESSHTVRYINQHHSKAGDYPHSMSR